jgi:hypothetical protein
VSDVVDFVAHPVLCFFMGTLIIGGWWSIFYTVRHPSENQSALWTATIGLALITLGYIRALYLNFY